MVRKLLLKLWNANPVHVFLGIMAIQVVVLASLPTWLLLGAVVVLAFLQNAAYSIQGRAALRSSNLYHIIGAIISGLAFYLSFRVLLRNGEMPPLLLPAYMVGTIFGSVYGSTISAWLEKLFGFTVMAPKDQPQWARFWPSVTFFAVAIVFWIYFGDWRSLGGYANQGIGSFLTDSSGKMVLLALVVISILDNTLFAILRVSRNTDHHWFHGCAVLLQLCFQFIRLSIMFEFKMDLALFGPLTAGSVIGSLTGTYAAKEAERLLKAKYDAHVTEKKKVTWPAVQVASFSFLAVFHLYYFGTANILMLGLLFISAFAQSVSFTLISRARQRNSKPYIAWASVLSNGVWYWTIHLLAARSITPDKTVPYILGSADGGMVGQTLAMKIEQKIGALMEEPITATPAVKTA